MSGYKKNIPHLLAQAQLAINNGQSIPEIAAALADYGRDAAHMQEGAQLYEEAHRLHAHKVLAFGDQQIAHKELAQARNQARSSYNTHRALVRLALKDDPIRLSALGVTGYRQQSLDGWIGATNNFYTQVRDDALALERLADYKFGLPQIELAQTALAHIAELNSLYKQRRVSAQTTRQERDRALCALETWLNNLRSVAYIALAQTPPLLIALGFNPAAVRTRHSTGIAPPPAPDV